MATPITASRMLTILRAEGCTVVEVTLDGKSWRDNNREEHGAWGPVNGVVEHHTVSSGTQNTVEMCFRGYTRLPGPLCHGVIDKSGTIHMVGNGRANHAGSGDGDVLSAVIAESPVLPAPNEQNTDGNIHFYGFECINLGDGTDPWPPAQLDAMIRAAAAICREHGWSAYSVIGHKEWTATKNDPRGFTMTWFRSQVAARLSAAPTPAPPTEETTEVTSITAKDTANSIDVALTPGVWTGLAFGGSTPAVLIDGGSAGKKVISQMVHLSFEQSPDITVTGSFYLTDPDGVSGISGYQETGPRIGGGGHQFHFSGTVPAGRHLRFRVKVDRPGGGTETFALLHRTESSRIWEV